ncbi:SapC family protein [Paraferrimonas sp. SM1919]|uniref:SapC family protein n=1 Tax=Paraferrimonas sp. SM1919 TaxID=2662263 RepID=UPI0013D6AC7F|nr:SapC family protein [Paraferrimonas sp. SM1919]
MSHLVQVNYDFHHHLKIDPTLAHLSAADVHLMPIVVQEFINIASQSPIVITKDGDTGQFGFSALLGFAEKQNLFFRDGQWQGLYLPLQIQRQPFFIEQVSQENFAVCINIDSPMIVSEHHNQQQLQRLFIDGGQESSYLSNAKQCLGQLLQGEIDNKNLMEALLEAQLIQPLSLEITFVDNSKTRLNGLYTIDQDKLAKLPDSKVNELHKAELLQPIYTMITSLGQMYRLIDKQNQRLG